MASYPEDIRMFRRTKNEVHAPWLIWRKGKFSADELESIKRGLDTWVTDQCGERNLSREEVLESLKWARDNKLTAWCEIATNISLPERKIGSLRHCILRRYMPGSEVGGWTKSQTREFILLQEEFGPRAWKRISQATGRSLECVVNKGRQLAQSSQKGVFAKTDSLHLKLKQLQRGNDAPYEFNAIRSDCKLVALIRKYHDVTESVHNIPCRKIARKLGTTSDAVRLRWHQQILPRIVERASAVAPLHDEYLINLTYEASQGRGTKGVQIFPAYDLDSIDYASLMPLWPISQTLGKLKAILRQHPRHGLAPMPEILKAMMDSPYTEMTHETHFDEIKRIVSIMADRGNEFIAQDKILDYTE